MLRPAHFDGCAGGAEDLSVALDEGSRRNAFCTKWRLISLLRRLLGTQKAQG